MVLGAAAGAGILFMGGWEAIGGFKYGSHQGQLMFLKGLWLLFRNRVERVG